MLRSSERGLRLKDISGLEHLLDLVAFMRSFPIDMSAFDRWSEKRWPAIEKELQESLSCPGLAGFIDEYAESLAGDLLRMLECCGAQEVPEAAAAFIESLASQTQYAISRAQSEQAATDIEVMVELPLPGIPEHSYPMAA